MEKKNQIVTYWHYTFQKIRQCQLSYGVGTQISQKEEFYFADYYKKHPDFILMNVNEISKEQYDRLNEVINMKRENKNKSLEEMRSMYQEELKNKH